MTLNTLISGHGRFKDSFDKHQGSWARLVGEGQQPYVLWIGCSDSRVIPEQITAARPGDMLVVRNIANVVPPYGTTGDATAAVLEYAILKLGVEHVIVCGHTFCGGVGAILDQGSLNATSHMARWLSLIRPALSQVEASGSPAEERWMETIKANVLLQCGNVESYPEVRDALKTGRLSLHGWLFDLKSGDLKTYDDVTKKWQDVSSHSDEQEIIPE
jgi:carbonic anhydrase